MSDQLSESNAIESTDDSAVVETPVTTDAETTPEHTPESDAEAEAVDTASEDVEDGVEAAPDTKTEEASSDVDADDLDFSDLTPNFIPSDEVINKLRIPKEDRAQLVQTAQIARESSAKIEGFGGDFAMESLKPLGNALTKATLSEDETIEIVNSMIAANAQVTSVLSQELAVATFMHEPTFNRIFTAKLGANATLENIKELLALDAGGLIERDVDELGFQPGKLYDLQAENAELKKQLEGAAQAPVVDQRATRAVKDFEADVRPEISKKIEGVFDRVKWGGDSERAKIVTELVMSRIKADPTYQNVVDFLESSGSYRNGDARHGVVEANLQMLRNKSLAHATELVRLIQADTRKQSETSRNRIIQEKQATPKPKEITPQPMPDINLTLEQRQELLRKQYLATLQPA